MSTIQQDFSLLGVVNNASNLPCLVHVAFLRLAFCQPSLVETHGDLGHAQVLALAKYGEQTHLRV